MVGVERKANKEVSCYVMVPRGGDKGRDGMGRDGIVRVLRARMFLEAVFDVLSTLSDVLKLALIFSAHGKVIVRRRKSHE
jgi:hypothetical protein